MPRMSGIQRPVFQALQLTKTYPMGDVLVHALRGVDLELYAGEFVVILGASGSGPGFVAAGTPILEVGDPSQMEVLVDVLSTAAVSIKPGAKVEIRGWGGPNPLGGSVRRIEPSAFLKISALGVEERRVNVLIDLNQPWESRKELGDGFRVDANIQIDKSDRDVPTIPTTCLESSQGKWYVYKVNQSSWGGHWVQRTEVDIGFPPETIRDGTWITY
ncbi:MAG: HlyD family efflux transporter periplasmic adaptor subunit [Pirellula sp.]